ncbi:MAG: response regulator [Dehalococcoidia bacterium]|nr:response regulator [Dehalococcoidia bacterium]
MTRPDSLQQEIETLRERLNRLSEASLRINESLDLDTVVQDALDSARSLTDARYGVITLLDDSGEVQDLLASGLTPEQARGCWDMPDGTRFFQYLNTIPGPLRLRDFYSHAGSLGLPELRPPVPVSSPFAFLAAPIRHRGQRVGGIYVAEKEDGGEFSLEDEETLVTFASQAALVIANARRYREEHRARKHLEAVIDTSPVGVAVFDARTGQPRSVNREARRIVGELHGPDDSAEDLLEVLTFRRTDGHEVSLAEFPLAQALSTGEAIRAEEIVIQVPDGRCITTLVNATPIHSEEGCVESVVVTVQDMTPLEELERLRAEFLGVVSHELRTPLTSIRGSADTLMEAWADLDPAEMHQFFKIIREQADHMRDLIGNLLDVARIEMGTLSMNPESIELGRVIDDARSRFLLGGGGDRLRIDVAPDLPPVMADPRRIVQVLVNLLFNAAKNSEERSAIRVTAVLEELYVCVSVSDEGKGISAERLPHLFRKFSRSETEEQESPTGLGLAICKGIVEAHGGRIWAESEGPGLGARFTFTLPLAVYAAMPEGGDEGSAEPEVSAGTRERILAVDDDAQTLRYVRDSLARAGYTPVITSNPEEVYQLVKTTRPDLVLLDLVLPGTDGIGLMKGIFEIADVPVVFLSAYGQDQIIAKAFDMGASDYVVKPFSPTELVARIKAALRKPQGRDQSEPLEPYVVGDLAVDYAERLVTVGGGPVRLTATEYQVLFELSVNGGRVLAHHQLLQRVWGLGNSGDGRLLRTVVKRLRRKLGDDAANPSYVFTEPRVGYRMPKPEPPKAAAR